MAGEPEENGVNHKGGESHLLQQVLAYKDELQKIGIKDLLMENPDVVKLEGVVDQ